MRVLLCSAVAVAAAGAGGSVAEEIEELVVQGRLEETIPLELARYGHRLEIIDAAQIQLAGFDDAGQSLQMLVPGLYLTPKNGAFDYVTCSLQGSRCQDILWLVDGVRINNRLYNTTSPLDTVPAHMIERIEVLYGGQGIFYGTQSVAGVVNVVTKGFSDDPQGSVHLSADDNDGTHVSADFRAGSARHDVVLYASHDDADGFQPFENADYQPSGTDRRRSYEVASAGLRYGATLSDDTRVTVFYQHTDNTVDWASPANRARSYNERNEDLVTAKLDHRLSEAAELFVKAYWHDWDTLFSQIDNVLGADGSLTGEQMIVSDEEFWGYEDYGATTMLRMATDHGLQYSVGLDHQRYSGRDEVLLIADRTENMNAAFAQIATTEDLLEDSALALGVRYNRPRGEGDVTVWNLSGRHQLSRSVYARATLGTSFRAPDAWELYGNDPCCALGNPDLEGEQSENLNLAVGGHVDWAAGFDWELVGFTRNVEDLIGTENGIRVNSDASVDFEGLEVSLTVGLTDRLSVGFDYLHTNAEAEGSSEQIDDVPESLVKANVTFEGAGAPYDVTMSLVHVGDLYDTVSGGIGRVEHGNYTLVDLAFAWYPGQSRKHQLSLRLENATDERYASSLGRAFRDVDGGSYAYDNLGTPRTWHVGYRYRF